MRFTLCSLKRLGRGALLVMALALVSGNTPTAPAEDLLVVDCLLPGQVRQLGTRTTYVSPRRPTKTTAMDCRIRHGEYVVSDRANLRTALNVWLEQAKSGDPEAQTTLGEIFERGMGVAPDYAAAATWYRRAAEQNYTRAQVNLGHLYEKGLGVPQDAEIALGWYRRAAGLQAGIDLDTSPDVAPLLAAREQELDSLKARAQALERQVQTLAQELKASQDLLARRDERISDLDTTEPPADPEPEAKPDATPTPVPQGPPTKAVDEMRQSFDAQITEVARVVAAREQESQRLLADLHQVRAELAAAAQAATDLQAELDSRAHTLNQTEEELNQTEEERKRAAAEAASNRDQLAEAIRKLDEQHVLSQGREAEIERLTHELESIQQANERAQAASEPHLGAGAVTGAVAGPTITIIDPILPSARGMVKVTLPVTSAQQQVVGRVTAPAGLLALSVNDMPVQPNVAGVFRSQLDANPDNRTVEITAIDNQGKRADLTFTVAADSAPATPSAPRGNPIAKVDLGKYYALLIGNNDYQHLPRLSTPVNDIHRTAAVLQERYGFETLLLENATRYKILTALNDLRARLTSDDNLLVYYAGHGELDEVNLRGHWLPIDAEPGNTSNWLSNVAITDILNIIRAKHVFLIADSCYSGTLTRSSIAKQEVALTDAERVTWLKLMSKKRARVVLTSGGLAPVLDAGGGAHSVFAKALIEVLQSNTDLLEGRSLFQAVAARVAHAAANLQFEQAPQYAPIARAGHEAGDFFLRPRML